MLYIMYQKRTILECIGIVVYVYYIFLNIRVMNE